MAPKFYRELPKLLAHEPNLFKNVTDHIAQLTREDLLLELQVREQPQNVEEIQKQLIKTWGPHLRAGQDLDTFQSLTSGYISRFHAERRRRNFRRLPSPSPSPSPPRTPTPPPEPDPYQYPARPRNPSPPPSPRPPSHARSRSPLDTALEDFLRACKPPMTRYSLPFILHRTTKAQHLNNVGERTPQEIEHFVRGIFADPEVKISDKEVDVLVTQFLMYTGQISPV